MAEANWKYYYTLPHWNVGRIEIGKGTVYNFRWGEKQVLELDSDRNSFINQTLKLKKGVYVFRVRYASKRGLLETSQMSIHWNGVKVLHILPKDEEIHDLEVTLEAVDGDNTIELRAQGNADNFGMSITGLKLFS